MHKIKSIAVINTIITVASFFCYMFISKITSGHCGFHNKIKIEYQLLFKCHSTGRYKRQLAMSMPVFYLTVLIYARNTDRD